MKNYFAYLRHSSLMTDEETIVMFKDNKFIREVTIRIVETDNAYHSVIEKNLLPEQTNETSTTYSI